MISIIYIPDRVKFFGFNSFKLLISTLKVHSKIRILRSTTELHLSSGRVEGFWPELHTLELSIHIPAGQLDRHVEFIVKSTNEF